MFNPQAEARQQTDRLAHSEHGLHSKNWCTFIEYERNWLQPTEAKYALNITPDARIRLTSLSRAFHQSKRYKDQGESENLCDWNYWGRSLELCAEPSMAISVCSFRWLIHTDLSFLTSFFFQPITSNACIYHLPPVMHASITYHQ